MSRLGTGRWALLLVLASFLGASTALAKPAPRAAASARASTSKSKPSKGKPSKGKRATASKPKRAGTSSTAAAGASRKRPAGKRAVTTRGGRTRGTAVAPRPRTVARVTIAGLPRAGGEPLGRRPDGAVTAAERTADAIDEILRGPLRYGTTGLYVVDAATGAELFSVHPDDPLNPASNVKLIATATALDNVGADFRYQTRALGVAPDAAGAVAGSLYLHGSFDPTLTVAGIQELATQVAARGVRAIAGDVVAGPQPTRDAIYRAWINVAVSASIPGTAPGVEVTPATDFVEVVNRATTSKRAKVKRGGISIAATMIERDGRPRLQLTITGAVGKGKAVVRSVTPKQRGLFTAHVLRAALIKAGVTVAGDVRIAPLDQFVAEAATTGHLPIELGSHRSQPLADVVTRINKRSINWLADRVLTTTTALARGGQPTMADGVDAMYQWLARRAGIDRSKAVLDTGSGLSYRTELSARQLVKVVRIATGAATTTDPAEAAAGAALRQSLAVGGVDGTLRGRFRSPLRGRVHAKTGTLTGVIALSGVLEGPRGRTLAFSLVTNGHSNRYKLGVRAGHERILNQLDRYLNDLPPEDLDATADPSIAPDESAGAPDELDDNAAPASAGDDDE